MKITITGLALIFFLASVIEAVATTAETTIALRMQQIAENALCQEYSKEKPPYGKTFTENISGLQMEFVWIPGGCFIMGQEGWVDNMSPEHLVALHGFYLGKYEVTNSQYRKFNASHDSGVYKGKSLNGDLQPVVMVGWDDVHKYIDWIREKSGKRYRLPTEAEWEYAARGSAARRGRNLEFFWGNNTEDDKEACRYENISDETVKEVGWFPSFECKDNYAVTAPVGRFIANDYGLYDMLGNVSEWCSDIFGADYYTKSPVDNPQGAKEVSMYEYDRLSGGERYIHYPRGANGEADLLHVTRGGSWYSPGGYARLAFRFWEWTHSAGDKKLGIRLVLPVY